MYSVAKRIRTRLLKDLFPSLYRTDVRRDDLVRIGSNYGGWWVPGDMLGPESICYLGGVGTDITFDIGLIERYGCHVWGIDPTPKSLDWIAGQTLDERFAMIPVGLAAEPGTLRFYVPQDPDHVSHSIKNLQHTDAYFEARVTTVAGLMGELGHDHVDLLKLDIEGAEHDTIRALLLDGLRPQVLCVEFDQPEPLAWGRATAAALRAARYDLAKVDGFNLTFVLRQ
jgi:FkbM family methyltransferase